MISGNEIINEWLVKMYDNEIGETKGAISNERAFQKGADGVEIDMHEQNIQTLEEYIEILENLKSDVIS